MEGQLDRLLVERFVEGAVVEIAGPLVERAGHQRKRAGLAGGSCAAPPRKANSSETIGTA